MAQAQQNMSYAQALNEAKQVIIQQSSRIKADVEKARNQQKIIADHATVISDHEGVIAAQAADLERRAAELRTLEQSYTQAEAGRAQAEGVVNRQGERINHLEAQLDELGRRLEAQADEIAGLRIERDELRAQLPTSEDIEALSDMTMLLSQKRGNGGNASGAAPKHCTMRIVAEAA